MKITKAHCVFPILLLVTCVSKIPGMDSNTLDTPDKCGLTPLQNCAALHSSRFHMYNAETQALEISKALKEADSLFSQGASLDIVSPGGKFKGLTFVEIIHVQKEDASPLHQEYLTSLYKMARAHATERQQQIENTLVVFMPLDLAKEVAQYYQQAKLVHTEVDIKRCLRIVAENRRSDSPTSVQYYRSFADDSHMFGEPFPFGGKSGRSSPTNTAFVPRDYR